MYDKLAHSFNNLPSWKDYFNFSAKRETASNYFC